MSRIYDALIKGGADRGSVVIAVGGGVIGDTAGFAAATYLRGMTLVQVPTTLLAQVDSSVGGKVGVNLPVGKNLVGAFHQPAVVVIDPLLLKTLPRREFRSGLYEVVKYGMIASRSLFDLIAHDTRRVFDRDPARARAGHRRVVPHQGPRRHRRRTRKRPASHSQLRAHDRPRARSGHASTAASNTVKQSPSACWVPPISPWRARRSPSSERQALAKLIARAGSAPADRDLPHRGRDGGDQARQEGGARPAALRHRHRDRRDHDRSTTSPRTSCAPSLDALGLKN